MVSFWETFFLFRYIFILFSNDMLEFSDQNILYMSFESDGDRKLVIQMQQLIEYYEVTLGARCLK